MIASLNGKLVYTDATTAVIECGGVGIRCFATANTLAKLPPRRLAGVFTYRNGC